MQLIGDAGRATESSIYSKMVSFFRSVLYRDIARLFHSSVSETAVERAVQNLLAEHHFVDKVATRAINGPAFVVLAARFVKHKAHQCSREEAEIDK